MSLRRGETEDDAAHDLALIAVLTSEVSTSLWE